jgi:hypothetical protein
LKPQHRDVNFTSAECNRRIREAFPSTFTEHLKIVRGQSLVEQMLRSYQVSQALGIDCKCRTVFFRLYEKNAMENVGLNGDHHSLTS